MINSATALKELQTTFADLLDTLATLADPSFAKRIAALKGRILSDQLKILIVGEFNRGKSTLLNAILGELILPSANLPTTAVINIVVGGPRLCARLERWDGSKEEIDLPAEKTNQALARFVSVSNPDAPKVHAVTVVVPGRLEHLQAELIDTPGVNDLDTSREDVTYGRLPEADAIILILDAQQPLSRSEIAFLRDRVLAADVRRIFFVLNKIDQEGGEALNRTVLIDSISRRLHEDAGISPVKIYPLSARRTLHSRLKGVRHDLDQDFNEFERALFNFAAQQAGVRRFPAYYENLMTVIEEIEATLNHTWASLDMEVQSAHQEALVVDQKQRMFEDLLADLGARRTAVKEEFQRALVAHAMLTIAEIRDAPVDFDAGQDSLELMQQFREAFNRAIRKVVESLNEKALSLTLAKRQQLQMEFGSLLDRSKGFISTARTPFLERDLEREMRNDAIGLVFGSDVRSQTMGLGTALVGVLHAVFTGTSIIRAIVDVFASMVRSNAPIGASRQTLLNEYQAAFDRIENKLDDLASAAARDVGDALIDDFVERGRERLRVVRATSNALREAHYFSESTRLNRKVDLERRLQSIQEIRRQSAAVRRTIIELLDEPTTI